MTVPRVFQKSSSDSNSLSFAITLPVQRKTPPLNPNASKKQLHPPLATLQEFQNVKKIGKANAVTNVPNGQVHGKEMGVNTTQNNYNVKTLDLVGAPLNWSNKINKGVTISRFGASAVNSNVRPRFGWKPNPRLNRKYMNKVMSPVAQFLTKSALRADTPLDEEIIVMGEPLIFTKGSKKVSYAINPIAQEGSIASGITVGNPSKVGMHNNSSGVHFHNPAAPVKHQAQGVRVQGAHITNLPPDHGDFHNYTTVSNVSEGQSSQAPQNNPAKTYDYLPGGVLDNGGNQDTNQWPTRQSNASQTGNQEEEDGYELGGLKDHGIHRSESVNTSNVDEEPLKQEKLGHQSRISEQTQTELVYENEHESIGDQGFGDSRNLTNYQDNQDNVTVNERYDNQENKTLNTDKLAQEQENSTSLQEESDGTEEKEMDTAQTINDNTNNLGQNQESKDDEQFAAGNSNTPLSNQRYVPVDEFGSPLYGTETGERVSHSL